MNVNTFPSSLTEHVRQGKKKVRQRLVKIALPEGNNNRRRSNSFTPTITTIRSLILSQPNACLIDYHYLY